MTRAWCECECKYRRRVARFHFFPLRRSRRVIRGATSGGQPVLWVPGAPDPACRASDEARNRARKFRETIEKCWKDFREKWPRVCESLPVCVWSTDVHQSLLIIIIAFFVQPSQFNFRLIYRPKCARNWILMCAEEGIMAIMVEDGPRGNMKIVSLTHISPERLWRHRSISEGTFFSESPSRPALHVSRPSRAVLGWTRGPASRKRHFSDISRWTHVVRTHNRSNRGLCLWLCKNFSFARRMPADRVQMKTSFLLYLVVFKLFSHFFFTPNKIFSFQMWIIIFSLVCGVAA